MLKKIKRFLSDLRKGRDGDAQEARQIALAQQLRDMLSVARKLEMTVVMTIEVGKLKQGVVLAGDGPQAEWLYNFACGEVMARQAELRTDAKLGQDWKGGRIVYRDGRVEISGSEGP
jgi:hypothetical protein